MNHTVYPVGNFKFGTKAAKEVKYPTIDAQMERLQTKYEAEGPRRSVDAVLVVHQVSPLPIRYLRAARKKNIVASGLLLTASLLSLTFPNTEQPPAYSAATGGSDLLQTAREQQSLGL